MGTSPPGEVGMPIEDVDTPALLIDLDVFERNLRRMVDKVKGTSARLRPHAKAHKCPMIALQQIALGAVGVCCQKVSEAEAMVYGGVRDVLVTNEVVGARKLKRLGSLARHAHMGICVDNADNVLSLSEAAQSFGATIDVLVEIDVGANRCGVEPGAPARDLARKVDRAPGLRFAGLQAYQGAAQHIRSYAERRQAVSDASEKAASTRDLLERDGLPCENITGAGTGTYSFEASSGVYTELQAGSYIFMDVDYLRNLDEHGEPMREFEPGLFVYATVMSRPVPERAVVDAGLKALSVDSGLPSIRGREDLEYAVPSDEHGVLRVHRQDALQIGDKIKLIPGHCDPTVNLYDWYVGVRHGRVETLWPITARGALL
ncbi:MAG: DSD1 family PLP-dependent enzyme [Arenicellales bacterium]